MLNVLRDGQFCLFLAHQEGIFIFNHSVMVIYDLEPKCAMVVHGERNSKLTAILSKKMKLIVESEKTHKIHGSTTFPK